MVAECFGGSELFGEPLTNVEGALVGGFGLGPVALCPVHVTDLVEADRVVAECFGGSELFGEALGEILCLSAQSQCIICVPSGRGQGAEPLKHDEPAALIWHRTRDFAQVMSGPGWIVSQADSSSPFVERCQQFTLACLLGLLDQMVELL